MADARCRGSGAPFVGQPPLAIYANLLLGLHDFRRDYRNLVPGRRASAYPAHLADGASGLFSRRTKALPIVPWRYPRTTVWPRELPIADCSESGVAVNCGKMPNRLVPAGRYSARADADNVETQGGGSGDFD